MTHKRLFFFLLVCVFLATGTYFLIQIAKGYRFDFSQRRFTLQPTGLLVATSYPDGAQIFVEGKLLSATNTTMNLNPGTYRVEIKKEGFHAWQKNLKIEPELVTKTEAWLFPVLPDFKALTYAGAEEPLISPDGWKVVYKVESESNPEKSGLWVLDLGELPFGVLREPKQIIKSTSAYNFAKAIFTWSPDSKQILATFQSRPEENFLLDPGSLNARLADITDRLPIIRRQWEAEEKMRQEQKMVKLPPELMKILQTSTANIIFSPDETKIAYLATASASIPDNLIPPIHSFSNQPQERNLKPNQTYTYDTKEDRNSLIFADKICRLSLFPLLPTPTPTPKTRSAKNQTSPQTEPACTLRWAPDSRHLLLAEKEKITILEFEGTNQTEIYKGSYRYPYAYLFPSANKLLILTTLATTANTLPNLYAVSLK